MTQCPGAPRAVSAQGQSPPLGFGAGWDLIVPAHCGLAFWLTLVGAGARPAGLRELRALRLEQVRAAHSVWPCPSGGVPLRIALLVVLSASSSD